MDAEFDTWADDYEAYRDWFPEVLEAVYTTFPEDVERVLDVGCGSGSYARQIARHGVDVRGVDTSREMISEALEQSGAASYRVADATSTGFPAAYFDACYMIDVIHHLTGAERSKAFEEAQRILRAGGVYMIVTTSQEQIRGSVMTQYFPETLDLGLHAFPPVPQIRQDLAAAKFQEITADTVTADVDEERFLAAFRNQTYSPLRKIPDEAFQQGLERLEHDFENGDFNGFMEYTVLTASWK